MPQQCWITTSCTDVPGTGQAVEDNTESWSARAASIENFDSTDSFTYSFDPKVETPFFSGVYDDSAKALPLPSRYLVAFEVIALKAAVWHNGVRVAEDLNWSLGDRFHIRYDAGLITCLIGNTEVWSNA